MFPIPRPCRLNTRLLSLTLLSGAFLLAAIPMAVAQAETCDLTGKPGTRQTDARKGRLLLTVLHDASGQLDGAVAPQLTITFVEDGSARAHGTIHLSDADPPAVLMATGEARVVCQDGGITGLTVSVRHPSGDTGVLTFDLSDSSQPIDASGVYEVDLTLTVGDTTLTSGLELVVKMIDAEG
jgi:hypothetical protein